MTQLAADFAAKGLLNLIMSSPVAMGLAHWYSSFDFIKFSLRERCSVVNNINKSVICWLHPVLIICLLISPFGKPMKPLYAKDL